MTGYMKTIALFFIVFFIITGPRCALSNGRGDEARTKIYPAPKTYVDFAFGKISYGLAYSITGSSTRTAETTATSSVDFDDVQSDTVTTSSGDAITDTLVNTVGSSLGFDLSKLSYSGSLTFGHTKESKDVKTYTDNDIAQRSNVLKYHTDMQQKVTQLDTAGVQLVDKSGYVHLTMEIKNNSLEKISISRIKLDIDVIDQSDGSRVDLLGPIIIGEETRLDGTIVGSTTLTLDTSLSVDIEPRTTYTRSVTFGGSGMTVPNETIINYMRKSLVMVPRIESYVLSINGRVVDPETEAADLLKHAASVTVQKPDGSQQVGFVDTTKPISIYGGLKAMGLDPKVQGTIISSMIGAVSGPKPSLPPQLYADSTKIARWIVVRDNQIVDVNKALVAGNQVYVSYVSNLDLIRAFPPQDALDGNLSIFCDNYEHSNIIFLHNVQSGTILRFHISETRAGVTSSVVNLSDTLTDNSVNTYLHDPISHKGFASSIQATTTLVNNDVLKVSQFLVVSDLSGQQTPPGQNVDASSANLAISINSGANKLYISDLVQRGDAQIYQDHNGDEVIAVVVKDEYLGKKDPSQVFGILPIEFHSSPVTMQLGRQDKIPPPVPPHNAYVGPDIWAAAASWPRSFPFASVKYYPSEMYKLHIDSVDAVHVGANDKLVNPGNLTLELTDRYCGLAFFQAAPQPSCPSIIMRPAAASPPVCWRTNP